MDCALWSLAMNSTLKTASLSSLRLTAIAAAIAVLFGAGAADARIATNGVTSNRIATNLIATNRIATNRIATNRIATNRIATNGVAVNGRAKANPFAGLDRKPIAR